MKLYVAVFLSTIVHSNCHGVHNLHGGFAVTGPHVQGALHKLASVVSGGLAGAGLNFGFGVNVNHDANSGHESSDYYENNEPNAYAPTYYNNPPPHHHHHHHHHGYNHQYGYGGPPVNRFPPQPNNQYGQDPYPGYNQEQVQHGYGRPQSGHYGSADYGNNNNQGVLSPNQDQQNYANGNYNPPEPNYGRPQYGGNIGQHNQEEVNVQEPNAPHTNPTTPNQYRPDYPANNYKPGNGYGRPSQFGNNNNQHNINQPDNTDNVNEPNTQKPSLPTPVTPQPKPMDNSGNNSGKGPDPVPSIQNTKKPDDDTPFVPLKPNKQDNSVNAPKFDDDGEEIFDLDIRIND